MLLQHLTLDDDTHLGPSVVAIGNFDGVHLGHRALVDAAVRRARDYAVPAYVLTFSPHPAEVLGRCPKDRLTSLEARALLLRELGIDSTIACRFDLALAQRSAQDFVVEVLAKRLSARHVVVGEDFHFGRDRQGTLETLRELGRQHGFSADALPLVRDAEGPISSSRIRATLLAGNVEQAARLLGRAHEISGVVVRGQAIGRTIGFPTANLEGLDALVPQNGVYAVFATVEGSTTANPSVLNIGVRPTVDGSGRRTVEVHLLDWDRELVGSRLTLRFVARLRDEKKFAGVAELSAQIRNDVSNAQCVLRDA